MSITRRAALTGLAAVTAISGLAPRAGAAPRRARPLWQPAQSTPGAVFRHRIPKTGELVPAIGLGTARTFNVDPESESALAPLVEVVRIFLASGGSVIDSSPMYGRSEEVVGRILAKLGREDVFSATKVWTDKGKEAGSQQMATSAQR